MKLTVSKELDFVPEFNRNRFLPTTEQIIVRLKNPTTAIKNRCKPQTKTTAVSDKAGNISHMEFIMETDDVSLLREMIISISGCSYEDGSCEEKLIRNAQDLINAPIIFEPLLKEVVAEVTRVLNDSEINEKNSE